MQPSDGTVVRRVLAGDVEHYRVLVERYRAEFGRYAVAAVGDAGRIRPILEAHGETTLWDADGPRE